MANVVPFRGWRATSELAPRVASVPYDVVNREEALALAAENPISYLHVTKPEIDFAAHVDPTSESVYAHGAMALHQFISQGVLVQDLRPSYYAYALTLGAHRQLGVVLAASLGDYINGVLLKHEHTRPDKELDRVRHMEAVGAQTGKVFVVHRPQATIAQVLAAVVEVPAEVDFTAADGVRHQLWVIHEAERLRALTEAFTAVGRLYIADGHHRAAAASRVAVSRRAMGHARPDSLSERLLAVAFATDQVQILPYHRVVQDLAGQTPEQLITALRDKFEVRAGRPPDQRGTFGMYMAGQWYTLVSKSSILGYDAVGKLDVSILQQHVLAPLCKIEDARLDKRIDFVGGIHGEAELERRVQKGWAVAFRLHRTDIKDLLAVADAGAVMPPKSTWFEPKLRDGLVTLRFDPG